MCVTLYVKGVIDMVDREPHAGIDMTCRYTLCSGARVIVRAPDAVQIGTDPPRCVVLTNAPRESLRLLRGLDGGATVGALLTRLDADPLVWSRLLGELLRADLLVPVRQRSAAGRPAAPHLTTERAALVHRHGGRTADRILQARDDAVVVLHGRSAVTTAIAGTIAAAGIGNVHVDAAPIGLNGAGLMDRFAAIREQRPAAHQPPTVAVLAAAAVPDLGLAATYTRRLVPHLALTTGPSRVVVGPLVLPGRSSCLSCGHRHRADLDPAWPAVARQLAGGHQPPAVLAAAAALAAAGAVLDHVDGLVTPSTVNGTLEWQAGDQAPRRRSWTPHPGCGCHG